MPVSYGVVHSLSPDGGFSLHRPVAGLPETFGAVLGAHIDYPGTELLTVADGQPDQRQGTVTLAIHCLTCGGKFGRDYLTELEATACLIGFHGGHEGHHLAFRINRRSWLITCDCTQHQLPQLVTDDG